VVLSGGQGGGIWYPLMSQLFIFTSTLHSHTDKNNNKTTTKKQHHKANNCANSSGVYIFKPSSVSSEGDITKVYTVPKYHNFTTTSSITIHSHGKFHCDAYRKLILLTTRKTAPFFFTWQDYNELLSSASVSSCYERQDSSAQTPYTLTIRATL